MDRAPTRGIEELRSGAWVFSSLVPIESTHGSSMELHRIFPMNPSLVCPSRQCLRVSVRMSNRSILAESGYRDREQHRVSDCRTCNKVANRYMYMYSGDKLLPFSHIALAWR